MWQHPAILDQGRVSRISRPFSCGFHVDPIVLSCDGVASSNDLEADGDIAKICARPHDTKSLPFYCICSASLSFFCFLRRGRGWQTLTFPMCERFAGLLISMKGCRTNRSVLKSWRASPEETAAC